MEDEEGHVAVGGGTDAESEADAEEEGDDREHAFVEVEEETYEQAFARMRRRAAKVDEATIFARNPEPPADVHCTLKSESEVAVWFTFDHRQWQGADKVTGWEIIRYRRQVRPGTLDTGHCTLDTRHWILDSPGWGSGQEG